MQISAQERRRPPVQQVYICIDLKSFFASVECVERGLDPMTAKLVVADPTRTEKTICLAVSPALRALGVSTATLGIPLTSPALEPDSFQCSPRVKPWVFTSDLPCRLRSLYTQ